MEEETGNIKRAVLCIILIAVLSTSVFALEVPFEAVVQNLNGSQQVIRTYILPSEGDPQGLIEEPFVLEGYLHTFVDIMKARNRTDDTRAETEAVTIETAKNDLSLILGQLAPTIDYDDGQYQGALTLDHTTTYAEAAGYTTKSCTATTTKTIGSVDRNDMSYVPAITVRDGCTLDPSNMEWQVTGTELIGRALIPSSYQAVATYFGAVFYSATASYVTTADYVGGVFRDEAESVTYQLTYLSEVDVSAGSKDGPWFPFVLSTRRPYILGDVGSAVFLILMTLLLRSRREIRRLRNKQGSMLPEDDNGEGESERETDSTIS